MFDHMFDTVIAWLHLLKAKMSYRILAPELEFSIKKALRQKMMTRMQYFAYALLLSVFVIVLYS